MLRPSSARLRQQAVLSSPSHRTLVPNRDLKILCFPTECCQKEFSPSAMRPQSLETHHIVGSSVPRKEGWDKVTGAARYVDDMVLPGMLHGATVRSSIPRGKI